MRTVRVAEIAEQLRGVTYGKEDASLVPANDMIPLLRANNITNEGIDFADIIYVKANKVSDRQKLKRGDVVIAASSGSISVVGKAAQLEADYDGSFGAFCKVLRPSSQVWPRYFGHFFRTPAYRKRMSNLAAGANINNLKNEHIDDLEIPLPSLVEQERIAAILDQADSLRRLRQRAIDRLNSLGQAIFFEMFGDPQSNPKGLHKEPLGSLIKVASGEGLTSENMMGGQYPVYGGNGINGWHDQTCVSANTIVIGRVGVYCGAVHVTETDAWVTDNALIVSKKQDISTAYLAAALKYANLNQYAGRSAQPLVSGSRIYPVDILIPPISEQVVFEKRIIGLQSEIGRYIQARTKTDTLFSSLQHRAFRGEL